MGETSGARHQGTVSWFNEQKGFGFIVADDGVEFFVHYHEIERDGFQTLEVGEAVSFENAGDSGAPKATRVRPVDE